MVDLFVNYQRNVMKVNDLEQFDVIIVGAGPAGCAAAIEIGNRGMNALVLEKGLPNKDKPCGDGFLSSAIAILEGYGLSEQDFVNMQGAPFRSASICDDSSAMLFEIKADEGLGWLIPRRVLDQKLREIVQQKSRISYDSKVLTVEYEGDRLWKVGYRRENCLGHCYSKAVILATGALNKFSIQWNISGLPEDSVAISAYADMSSVESAVFQFTSSKPGYGWIFPYSNGMVNVGIGSLGRDAAQLKAAATDFLDKWKIGSRQKWRGGNGPIWSGKADCWHNNNGIVSCGDAAGLIDPLSGEGITAALVSGQMAGFGIHNYIADAFNENHMLYYSLLVHQYFKERYSENSMRTEWKRFCGY
jgi:geranylgeranyl reductase family protein